MTIFEKLQKARVELLSLGLKKSGKNNFANFEYFELADFLPQTQKILKENGLMSHFQLTNELATLTLFSEDEKIEFVIPVVFANNGKTQDIQNLGATITYLRRYLWLIAMEIVEADAIDVLPPQPQKEDKKDNIEDLYQCFLSLEKSKIIPNDKIESVEKVKKYFQEKKLKIQTLKNAIDFLGELEDKKEIPIKLEKLSDSDLMLAFEDEGGKK